MTPRFYARYLIRESRGARGRLAFFVACLAVGVAAIVALGGLAAGVDGGIRAEARKLLAADLAVEGRQPAPPAIEELLGRRDDLEIARIKELATVAAAPGSGDRPGRSQLVELKAVSGGYPFYGVLATDPPRPLAELVAGQRVVVATDLLERLGLEVGAGLLLGGRRFEIAGTVVAEPDRIAGAFSLGPRVFLSFDSLASTDLEAYGSRVLYRTLIKLPPAAGRSRLERLAADLRDRLGDPPAHRVETHAEAQPMLRDGIRRLEKFLGLVALLSVLLGGVGVAQTTRAWLAGRMDAIAVVRCLGLRPREVLLLYLGQTAVLGLAGSLLGAAAGVAAQAAAARLLGDLLPSATIALLQPEAILRGLGLGLGVALLFAIGPLLAVRRVPPLRVLRSDVDPVPPPAWARALLAAGLLAGIGVLAAYQSASLRLGAQFTAALAAAAALLWLLARGLMLALGRLPREATRGRPWLRHGLAALARPGAATVQAVVALGVGVLMVLGISLVEDGLSRQLRAELPTQAPTAFLIDIQPHQWRAVEGLLRREGASRIESVPVVSARLRSVDGRSVTELTGDEGEDRRRRWALTREQRLTYLDELPEDNRVVEGALWSRPGVPEASVEEEFAAEAGIGLGSRLSFDVQGVPLELEVTSLREVDWRTFRINFFFVAEPGSLEGAPVYRLATARLPAERETTIQDRLAADFPNVTLLPIRQVLEKVAAILERLGAGVRFLGAFTALSGIVILAGAVSAGAVRRGREVALLKTLGMTRRGVVAMFSTEYALLGLAAGLVGVAGANLLAWTVLTRGFEVDWSFHPLATALALAASCSLTALAGVAASWRALARRPLEVLRAEG